MTPFSIRRPEAGAVPLLVSVPHTGTSLTEGLAARFSGETVRALPDTDWHLDRLYAFVPRLGATLLCARMSRYVIDLNRDPQGRSLYPGRFETELIPTRTFDGEPIYRPGEMPGPEERADRLERYYRPYHEALRRLLDEFVDRFGYALLFDAHSIRSHVPRLVPEPIPDLILGDGGGSACPPLIVTAVRSVHEASPYESAYNAPFRGGYITRHYGRPGERVAALQLEMAQRLYMEEAPPFRYDAGRAAALQPVLEETLRAYVEAGVRWAASLTRH